MDHTYYIPSHRRVYGTHKDSPDIALVLVASYLRELGVAGKVGRYDGASLYGDRVRVIVGCFGAGSCVITEHPIENRTGRLALPD